MSGYTSRRNQSILCFYHWEHGQIIENFCTLQDHLDFWNETKKGPYRYLALVVHPAGKV